MTRLSNAKYKGIKARFIKGDRYYSLSSIRDMIERASLEIRVKDGNE